MSKVSVKMNTPETARIDIGESSGNEPSNRAHLSDNSPPRNNMDRILTLLATIAFIIMFPITIFSAIKVCYEYERVLIFRLGRLKHKEAKGPGVFFVLPFVETFIKVDLRTISFTVPQQEILSKDSVTVEVDAVVYFKIHDPIASIIVIEDAKASTKLLAQTTLRNMLGTRTLSEMLQDRERLSQQMQDVLDDTTEPWGMKVERVEIKDIRLPRGMQRAMAAEAEAAREARAKVIAAEGERQASDALREAASRIADTPAALQLRFLQTLNTISAEHNSTIVFPFPIDLISAFLPRQQQQMFVPPQRQEQVPVPSTLSVIS